MVTKNFEQWMGAMSFGGTTSSVKMRNGEIGNSNITPSTRVLILGSDDTAPTKEDYDVAELSNLTIISRTKLPTSTSNQPSWDNVKNGWYTNIVVKNDTSEDIVVKEIGLFDGNSITSAKLLCREVISPVTIHPNETYSFSMTLG